MSGTIGNGPRLSSPRKYEDQEPKAIEKKGIVSILRSDSDQTKAPSLRRTLSADMSSKKWLAQNGFSPLKKIASSEEITKLAADSSSSDEGEDECEAKKEPERPRQSNVWSSILLSKKADDDSKLLPLYVHPLLKRSTSALSEKSLEICTESLGSETGSDVFSSSTPSEIDEAEEDKEEEQSLPQPQPQPQPESQPFDREELRAVKYNYYKKVSPKSFPPPLPSLASCDGPSLHVHSHRENGRLVLEAVSFPSLNYFHAQREDGRLVLTFADSSPSEEPNDEEMIDQEEVIDHKEDEDEEIEEIFETFEGDNDSEDEEDEETQDEEEEEAEEEEEEEEEEEMVKVESEHGAKEFEMVMEQANKLPCGVINVHRSAQMIKKLIGLDNRNPKWTTKYNKAIHLVDMEEEEGPNPLAQSLPRPPRVARLVSSPPAPTAAASLNSYEYFWRTKPTVATAINPPNKNSCNKVILSSNSTKNPKAYEKQELVLLRGNKADYLVPLLRGCREPRRSLLLWEPYCIATT